MWSRLLTAIALCAFSHPAIGQSVPSQATRQRVFIESFGDDQPNKDALAALTTALGTIDRFIVTENRERANLIVKGTASVRTSQELHGISDSTSVSVAGGGQSSNVSGSQVGNVGAVSGSSRGGFSSTGAGISDSQIATETLDLARISIRVLTEDGDVVWSTTQESRGAKFKSALTDAIEKATRQLSRDLSKIPQK